MAFESTPQLRIVASPNPFSDRVVDVELPAGGTILDLMHQAGCDRALLGGAHVHITDRAMTREPIRIERENWRRVRPKPGMHVSIRVVSTPGLGGGGGSKNPLQTILTIAVVAASWYVGSIAAGWAKTTLGLGKYASLGVGAFASGATPLIGSAIVNVRVPR